MRRLFVCTTVVGLVVPVTLLNSSQQSVSQKNESTFRVETRLALVRFSVTHAGHYVRTIHQDDIILEEDSEAQKIASFERGDSRTTAAEVVLVFDCTGSMADSDITSVLAFKKDLLDRFEFLRFSMYGLSGHDVREFVTSTRQIKALEGGLRRLRGFGGGSTFLYEAVSRVVSLLPEQDNSSTRTVVIFSDGISNDMGRDSLIDSALRKGITLNPVLEDIDADSLRAFVPHGTPATLLKIAQKVRVAFAGLANETGGLAFQRRTGSQNPLAGLIASLRDELSSEYVVGVYLAPSDNSVRTHELRVRLKNSQQGELIGGRRLLTH